MRADAARNRTRILDTARELLAERGLGMPLDVIAQRAGVGPGSLYRHFPAKNALVAAVVVDRFSEIIDMGRNLLSKNPPQALTKFLETLFTWITDDQAMIEVIAGPPVDLGRIAPDTERELDELLNQMLIAGHAARTIRDGITIADVKALLAVAKTPRHDSVSATRVFHVVIDGLRTQTQRS
ncbi:TetR/AcrR family transcriptional regulator [Mycobacteroides salmoniphilum]|uniref:HTH-type transcriptional repressor KstR n=1 Tax=Mycobacteroides salmoniphilum TaxID=404941 RepID=A0A4R8SLM3_9MYCO|nr:TetR/AcrR family transcriptional regulator [Mycobacteroides salmoniphilum]TDZ98527.1 HTH-type transcriptional repressor KstR [Mycobacteroides salmoniphilum]TEA03057.1 HTH-type transcriptional repressor KstR [Mycobacteroides salmoniphilum]